MNNEEQNTTQTNDFEIIDIPVENNANIDSIGTVSQPEIEQVNFDVQSEIPVEPVQPEISIEPVQSEIPVEPVQPEIPVESELTSTDVEPQETTNFPEVPIDSPIVNDYVPEDGMPQKQSKKGKMTKTTKELLAMAILAGLVIVLLPKMYELTSGNYHIIDKISSSITGLFNKSSDSKKTNAEKKEETKSEENKEDQTTTTKDETNVKDALSFDFSNYNNQVVDKTKIQSILDEYKDYLTELSSMSLNDVQTIKITILKTKTDNSIDVEKFKAEDLNTSFNYLVTVTDIDNNTTTITAVQQ